MDASRPHQERRRSSIPQGQRRGLRRVLLIVVPVFLLGGTVLPVYTAAACTRQGGDFLATTGWMVHAWLWRAHSGLFTIDM